MTSADDSSSIDPATHSKPGARPAAGFPTDPDTASPATDALGSAARVAAAAGTPPIGDDESDASSARGTTGLAGLAEDMATLLAEVKDATRRGVRWARHEVGDAAEAGADRTRHAASEACSFVRERPWQSLAIAALAGGAVVWLARRR